MCIRGTAYVSSRQPLDKRLNVNVIISLPSDVLLRMHRRGHLLAISGLQRQSAMSCDTTSNAYTYAGTNSHSYTDASSDADAYTYTSANSYTDASS